MVLGVEVRSQVAQLLRDRAVEHGQRYADQWDTFPEIAGTAEKNLLCELGVLSGYCTFCKRAINFCAKFSSDSDHNNLALAPEFFSSLLVKSTSFATFVLTGVTYPVLPLSLPASGSSAPGLPLGAQLAIPVP